MGELFSFDPAIFAAAGGAVLVDLLACVVPRSRKIFIFYLFFIFTIYKCKHLLYNIGA